MLDATQPAVYCVPGRPPTIVLTTGGVVAARVRRLADPPASARSVCHGLALAAIRLAIAVAALLPALAVTGT